MDFRRSPDRDEVLRYGDPTPRMFLGGDLRNPLAEVEATALLAESVGHTDLAASYWSYRVRALLTLGDLAAAEESRRHGLELMHRLPDFSNAAVQLMYANPLLAAFFTGDGWPDRFAERVEARPSREFSIFAAIGLALKALAAAGCGLAEVVAEDVAELQPAIERGAPFWVDYPDIMFSVSTALWWTDQTCFLEVVERNLRDRVLAPDFRNPKSDARLCLAYLCALDGRLDEARPWFAEARLVVDDRGARPLRAMCDFDEALALVRGAGRPFTDSAFPADIRAEVYALLAVATSSGPPAN